MAHDENDSDVRGDTRPADGRAAATSKYLKVFFDWSGVVISSAALALSIYASYGASRTQEFVATTEALNVEYSIYRELAALERENPFLAHLFSQSPEAYYTTSKKIKAALHGLDDKQRIEYELQERALAHFIFTVYEETYFHWTAARQAGDDRLAELLDANLVFFRSVALCNARLVWFFDANSGKLSEYFADGLREDYAEYVTEDCAVAPDPVGPIGVAIEP
jgi:hypothetical protein